MFSKNASFDKGGGVNKEGPTDSAVRSPHRLYTRIRIFWSVMYFTPSYVTNAAPSTAIDTNVFNMFIGQINTQWKLRIYPNGNDREKGCVGIHLMKVSEYTRHYDYTCRFAILRKEQEVFAREFTSRPSGYEALAEGCDFMLFLSHDELFQWYDEFVDAAGTMTICAEVQLSTPKIGHEPEGPAVETFNDVYVATAVLEVTEQLQQK